MFVLRRSRIVWDENGFNRLCREIKVNTMRYNKDFIAEMLAETTRGAGEEIRRATVRGTDTRYGLESRQTQNFRPASREEAMTRRLRDQEQVSPAVIDLITV